MKLGSETGSLINHLHSRATKGQPEPVVGMGATILGWTDRYAATITEVFKVGAKTTYIKVQEDHAKRIDSNGMSEMQTYEYTRDSNGTMWTFRFNIRSQQWEKVTWNPDSGRWNRAHSGMGLRLGKRDKYHDFSF